ncbi:UPF0146 family protein [Archaeoglobus veneficus]|uniref:UPF0146 protein Arcve_1956 n=1 Tax=Archaeoglobus veneficus (strain DSM 11195 / SNP6) TaxID=693661 RepID=F2KRT5_ARCVS|nr:UPF0146 family protein [Archaeoglobus veneficus]AEA47949.1 protein of unknown function UPF0146 [Archaeoglobus veneficus SNP6]
MRPEAIADYISRNYSTAVEVCVGNYWEIAKLIGDKLVAAVDVRHVKAPPGVRFIVDDVMNPSDLLLELCRQVELVYAIRPPPELWRYILALSKLSNSDCLIRPFGNEFAASPFRLVNYMGERFYVALLRQNVTEAD